MITKSAKNWGEMHAILEDSTIQDSKGLKIIEVFMTKEDAPDALKKLVAGAAKRNSGESVREVHTKQVEEKVTKVAG